MSSNLTLVEIFRRAKFQPTFVGKDTFCLTEQMHQSKKRAMSTKTIQTLLASGLSLRKFLERSLYDRTWQTFEVHLAKRISVRMDETTHMLSWGTKEASNANGPSHALANVRVSS